MKTHPLLLIAEDDPDDQMLIQDAVDVSCPPGIVTRFVWNGEELIEFLQNMPNGVGRPGLLLLDLNMPRKDGRVALKEIKANPDLSGIPVAVLTTSKNDRDAQYCKEHGVIGYYRKPSSITELKEIIGSLCMDYLD